MHDSRSQQGSSFAMPRAILMGEDAKLLISFTHSEMSFGNSLEVIRWLEDRSEFEFYRIDFDRAGNDPPHVSEPNPQECTLCHTGGVADGKLRPNWDTYWHWEGAYGSIDDMVTPLGTIYQGKPIQSANKLYRENLLDNAEHIKREADGLAGFLDGNGTRVPYSSLINLRQRYSELESTKPYQAEKEEPGFTNRLTARPNASLTERVFALNSRRVVRELLDAGIPKFTLMWISRYEKTYPKIRAMLGAIDAKKFRYQLKERFGSDVAATDKYEEGTSFGDQYSRLAAYMEKIGVSYPFVERLPNLATPFDIGKSSEFFAKIGYEKGTSDPFFSGASLNGQLYWWIEASLCDVGGLELRAALCDRRNFDLPPVDSFWYRAKYLNKIPRPGREDDVETVFEKYVRPEIEAIRKK